jgi:hypothetical protein
MSNINVGCWRAGNLLMLSSLIDRHTYSNAMKGQIMITQKELKQFLHYDQNTGIFTWIKKSGQKPIIGNIAGSTLLGGYIAIRLKNKRYLAHRLAWLYVYGKFPKNKIDHINGNPSDNKICNLRQATYQQNNCNSKKRKDNTSGVKGVVWRNDCKKWQAQLYINYKKIYFGTFDNLELAKLAIFEARVKYHGNYANNG